MRSRVSVLLFIIINGASSRGGEHAKMFCKKPCILKLEDGVGSARVDDGKWLRHLADTG